MVNEYEIRGRVTVIHIPYRCLKNNRIQRFEALIDTRDLPRVTKYARWRAQVAIHGVYVRARAGNGDVKLHRVVLGETEILPGLEPDHINRNPLDNRRRNLRLVTHADNCRNRRKQEVGAA